MRDYLYIPLGGNRLGNLRTCVNLMITMLLGGLWPTAILEFTGTEDFDYFGPNGDVRWKNIGTSPPAIEEFTFRYRIQD